MSKIYLNPKRLSIALLLAMGSLTTVPALALTCVNQTTGLWGDGTLWTASPGNCTAPPAMGDVVYIVPGTVSLNGVTTPELALIQVYYNATLDDAGSGAGSLTANGINIFTTVSLSSSLPTVIDFTKNNSNITTTGNITVGIDNLSIPAWQSGLFKMGSGTLTIGGNVTINPDTNNSTTYGKFLMTNGGNLRFTGSNAIITSVNGSGVSATIELKGTSANPLILNATGNATFDGGGNIALDYVHFTGGNWSKAATMTGSWSIANCTYDIGATVPANWNCTLALPAAPTNLTANNVMPTSLTLNWTDNSSNETGFKVYRNGTLITTTAANATSFNDTGLTCNTTYNYEVKATNANGDSSAVTTSATTTACAVANYTLTVTTGGTGTGNTTGSTANGPYPNGTAITLVAAANSGSTFAGWNPTTCVNGMALTADTTCTATFNLTQPPVVVQPSPTVPKTMDLYVYLGGDGGGRITTSDGHIECHKDSRDCMYTYDTGTYVKLVATPDAGSTFWAWGGNDDCEDGTVSLNGPRYCTAYFHKITQPLTVTKSGNGVGTVVTQPAGVDCGAKCQASFAADVTITLAAMPAAGSRFIGFTGYEDCGDGSVKLEKAKTCNAVFELLPITPTPVNYTVTVSVQGNGHVTSTPVGIDCGSVCTVTFASGTHVNLIAHAGNDSMFANFTGDVGCADGHFDADSNRSCVANFTVPTPPPTTQVNTGVAAFVLSNYEVIEGTGILNIAVKRVSGQDGVLTVDYATVDGNIAKAGLDFVGAHGTLTWADGDVADKTIVVTLLEHEEISEEELMEGEETFYIMLTDAQGAPVDKAMVSLLHEPEELVTPPTAVPTTPAPVTPTPAPTVVDTNCPPKIKLEASCDANFQTVSNIEVTDKGHLANAIVTGTLKNHGWISNLAVEEGASVSGGVITGRIDNKGSMSDFEFRGNSIVGGTLAGQIVNRKAGGVFQDVQLIAGTTITGGLLSGQITGDCAEPATLENVRILRGSHLSCVVLGDGVIVEEGVTIEGTEETPELPALGDAKATDAKGKSVKVKSVLSGGIASYLNQIYTQRISAGIDDAEEFKVLGGSPSGLVRTKGDNNVLEIANSTSGGAANERIVGLRFPDVPLDANANILHAYLAFIASGRDNKPVTLKIWGEKGNAGEFHNEAIDKELSSRPKTSATVDWIPTTWEIGRQYKTVDVGPIVKEILNSGWETYNDLAFYIDHKDGTGYRRAYSFDLDAALAPRLLIQIEGTLLGGKDYQTQATVKVAVDPVDVAGQITVDPKHVGQTADLFIYAIYQETADGAEIYLMRDGNGGIFLWNQNFADLVPFQAQVKLTDKQMVTLYKGVFLGKGLLKLYFGYRLQDGTVVQNGEPLTVTVE